MNLVVAVLCLGGFASLAFATQRQQHALLRRGLARRTCRRLRLGGAMLLLAALAALIDDRGWGVGLVMYSGYTSLAAGGVYCALIVATRRRGRHGRPT